jgi:hypothetical protein
MEAAPSAILKANLSDRTSFIASPRRAIRTRPATPEEKAEAGLQADAAAKAILLIVCKSTLKVIVQERPLAGDVTEAATTISSTEKRLPAETLDAATHLPLMSPDDLAVLGHRMMEVRPKCARCTCAAGYAPVVVALAQAAAQASHRPWTVTGLTGHFEDIKAVRTRPIVTDTPAVKAVSVAINQIIKAAGYAPQKA